MPLYFAYGSNMDRAAMAARCPRSSPLDVARLPAFRFVIGIQGWASVMPDRGHEVWGVLWHLAIDDVPALDRYENVAAGLYRKGRCAVWTEAGRRSALVYRMPKSALGRPRPGYMEAVIAAARENGLPDRYVAGLRRGQRPQR